MPYNELQMRQAEATLRSADGFVRRGLLIVGESHREPHGRGLVANLIQRGLVDDFFMEILDRFEFGVESGGSTTFVPADKWLREQAAARTDLKSNEVWKRNQIAFRMIFVLHGFDMKNPVPFTRLIEFAVSHGVRIHFIDADPSTNTSEVRSKYMRDKLLEVGTGAKSVLLVGSDHLKHGFLEAMSNTNCVLCIGA